MTPILLLLIAAIWALRWLLLAFLEWLSAAVDTLPGIDPEEVRQT